MQIHLTGLTPDYTFAAEFSFFDTAPADSWIHLGVGSPHELTGLTDDLLFLDYWLQEDIQWQGALNNTQQPAWTELPFEQISDRVSSPNCRVGSCLHNTGLVETLHFAIPYSVLGLLDTELCSTISFSQQLQAISPFCRVGSCDFPGRVINFYIILLHSQPCCPRQLHSTPPHCRVGSCQLISGLVEGTFAAGFYLDLEEPNFELDQQQTQLETFEQDRLQVTLEHCDPPPHCGVGSRFLAGQVGDTIDSDNSYCGTTLAVHLYHLRNSAVDCSPFCRVGSWLSQFFTGLVVQSTNGEGAPTDRPTWNQFLVALLLILFCTDTSDLAPDNWETTPGNRCQRLCFQIDCLCRQNWGWAPFTWLAYFACGSSILQQQIFYIPCRFCDIGLHFCRIFLAAPLQQSKHLFRGAFDRDWIAPSCWLIWPLGGLLFALTTFAHWNIFHLAPNSFSGGYSTSIAPLQRALNPPRSGGKSGPNSRRQALVFSLFCIWAFTMFTSLDTVDPEFGWSEGYIPAMGNVGTSNRIDPLPSHADVKQHGTQPPMCAGTPIELPNCKPSRVVKRSLQRAQRRAHSQGFAWYRGQCWTPNDFLRIGMQPIVQTPPKPKQYDLATCNASQGPRRRMTCLTWNCGGLSTHRLDELKQWLAMHQVHIAVITETRWSFQSEWSDNAWHHIHSADENHRGSGVLLLISKRLCDANDLRWQTVIPGRLVHARILLQPRHLDIVGCYQHVHSGHAKSMPLREAFWKALETTVQGLPTRNTLVMLGDMNCSLPESPGICGTSFFRWNEKPKQGPRHADGGRLLAILRQHGIVALNTWDASQSPTFAQNGAASRIDYVFTRQQHADGQARAVQTLWQAPFLPVQQHGHAPLLCHIARYWIPPKHHPRFGLTPNQKQRGQLAKRTDSVAWHEFLQATTPDVLAHLSQALSADRPEIQAVHDVAMKHFSQHFPAMSRSKNEDPWQRNAHVLNKWQHRQILQGLRFRTEQGIFRAWFHATKFQQLTRSHRRHARQLRRQRFEETLHQASLAAQSHDTHKLFDLINRFAPKIHRRRMQLRRDDGTLMTSCEERSLLVAYVRETWRGPTLTAMTNTHAPGVPFTVETLARALMLIPSQKATAAPCAPGIVWNSLAATLAPSLHAALACWWGHNPPWIPLQWRSGWLQLIPKPNKPPTRLQNLRPLALQCPVGKAILGILIQLASQQAEAAMRTWPIWAFMRRRSTQDPLLVVAQHCKRTRELIQSQRSTPHTRARTAVRWSICGGIQIFIDLEKAFDCINRVKLFAKLHLLGIHDNITQLLQCWHVETPYIVTHGGESVAIDVSRGLRQGCKGAPFLWNCMMVLMLMELQQKISLTWLQEHLSIYADDCHVGGHFTNAQELEFLLHAIGTLFSLLQEFDMKLNPNKSVALLATCGPKSRAVRAAHVRRDNRGEMLKIPMPAQQTMLIPIQDTAPYLGCIMSYHNFEDTSTWHRVKLASIAFSRLRRWLCNKHHFTLKHRLRLWRTCIVPIMSYGVFAVGVTNKGIKHMLTQICTMLRRIVGDHAHHTGHTNFEVFESFALPRPADILLEAIATLQRSHAQRLLSLANDDAVLKLDWSHLSQIQEQIVHAQAVHSLHRVETALSGEAADHNPCHFCNLCDFCTNSVAAFRRHCTTCHGISMFRSFAHPLHAYTTDGLPQCKHCEHSFSTWRSFRIHIERGCQALLLGPDSCTGLPAARTMTSLRQPRVDISMRGTQLMPIEALSLIKSKPWGNRLLQIISDDCLDQLAAEHEACGFLSKYCCLCGQHLHRTQDVHLHYRTEHAEYWHHVPQKSKVLTNLHSTESPCPHCRGVFKTHQCPVWTQVSALLLHGAGLHAEDAGHFEAVIRCDLCLKLFPDTTTLMTHLQSEHKLMGFSYNAARDSLNGEAICTHCGAAFSSLESLRSHISQGRCSCFDPNAATEVVPISQAMLDVCLHGKLFDQLRAPMDRLHLTIKCAQCKQVYQRAGDLANHLMTNHSKLWRQAQHLTLMLVDLVFSRHGCTCNPQIHQLRQNHICLPLRQIAMMYHRMDSIPFMPVQLNDQVLNHMLHASINKEMRFMINRIFAEREFHALWSNAEVTKFLSQTCTQCGQAHTTGTLCRHIQEAHLCGHRFVEFYFDTLVPAISNTLPSDHQCALCSQIFNLPPSPDQLDPHNRRALLVQDHLKGNCPVILQSSTLLAIALNGGRLGYDWLGSELPGADTGNVPVPGPVPGHQLETGVESQSSQATQNRRQGQVRLERSRSNRGRPAEADAVPPGPWAAGTQTRAQLEFAAKHRLFHPVFPAGQGGLHPCAPSGNPEMASAEDQKPGDSPDSTAPAPEPVLHAGHAEPDNQDFPMPAAGPSVQTLQRQAADPGGHELAILALGSNEEALGGGQEKGSLHGQDAGASHGTGGGISGPGAHLEIPRPPDQHTPDDSALEAANEHAVRQALRTDAGTDPLLGVASSGGIIETPFRPAQQFGQDSAKSPAEGTGERKGHREIQRQEQGPRCLTPEDQQKLFRQLALLVLGNDSNWCFANSMTYGLLWTFLCQQCLGPAQWGPHFETLHSFIMEFSGQTQMLTETSWFAQLLECWGRPQAQQDCGEFVHATLAWLASPAVNMAWERRCETNECVRCFDCGHADMPLTLQFTPELALHETCSFQQLIDVWHQVDGMRAGLLQAAPILCIHVDRLFKTKDDRIEKSSCAFTLDSDTRFPIYSNDKMMSTKIQYTIVAAAAHLGADAAGHYQALLRLKPAVVGQAMPVKWMITQDNIPSSCSWEIPAHLGQNITVAWFVRTDCLMLPDPLQILMPAEADEMTPTDMTQLLQMLNERKATD